MPCMKYHYHTIVRGSEATCLPLLQVVASMEIQEITRNREKFVHEIERVRDIVGNYI